MRLKDIFTFVYYSIVHYSGDIGRSVFGLENLPSVNYIIDCNKVIFSLQYKTLYTLKTAP